MVKKVSIIAIICASIFGQNYCEEKLDPTPAVQTETIIINEENIDNQTNNIKDEKPSENLDQEKIAFVLLTLVGNEIRMENYNTEELNAKLNKISTKTRNDHLRFKINMSEQGSTPRSIEWDKDNPGQMNIFTGKKSKSKIYTLELSSLFKDVEEEVMVVCFDCTIKNKKINKEEENKEEKENKTEWESHINVILPIEIDETKIKIIFDKKTKAACGFFMVKSDFDRLTKVSGELTKKQALNNNIISDKKIEKTNSEQQKTSLLSKIKNALISLKAKFMANLLSVKQTIGNSFNTCLGYVTGKK